MDENIKTDVSSLSSSQNDVDVPKERRVASKKTNKPLIEKRRRARINECLQQLKEIIVRERQLDNVRGNRLEKADILEMTVEYIRQLSHEGSPVSCVQSAYERGVERCVREMSEFMQSQHGVIDSSVSHKLTTHCRKMLSHHYPLTDDVKSQVTGSKRTVSIATEIMADSSTSPKRCRLDDDNESSVDITAENELTFNDNQRLGDTSKAGIISSVQYTSPVPVSLHSTLTMSNLVKAHEVHTNTPSSSLPYIGLTVQSEPVGSSSVQFSHDGCVEDPLIANCRNPTATNQTSFSNKQTDTSNHSISSGRENELATLNITASSITPPLSNFISKPVFFSYPGNIFILVDKPAVIPQPVLQNPLPGSVFPVEQNIITLLPAPLTYKLPTSLTYTSVDSPCSEIRLTQPIMSGSYTPSLSLQSIIPQNQTTMPNFTAGQDSPISALLNPGILVKHEPGNSTFVSLGQSSPVQYLLQSPDHQNGERQLVQHSPEMFRHLQNTSGQISENVQAKSLQISQNVHLESDQHSHNENVLQKNIATSADNLLNITQVPAGFTCSYLNNGLGPKVPEVEKSENKILEHSFPKNKILEHNLSVNKFMGHKMSDHKLADYKIPEPKLPENNVSEPKIPECRILDVASPKGVESAPTIIQTVQLPDKLSKSAESGNGCERYLQAFEGSQIDLRLVPGDDSCVLVSSGSTRAAPRNKVSTSSNKACNATWSCNESSILNATHLTSKDAATNELARVQHSTTQSDNHISASSNKTHVVHKPASCMSRPVPRIPYSHSDNREMFSHLQEFNLALDLSCKAPDISSCRNDRNNLDINNNSTGSPDHNKSRHDAPTKPFFCVNMSNKTNMVSADRISNMSVIPAVSSQTYSHKNTLNSSLYSRTFYDLDHSSVWRPWGSNPELKELH